MKLEKVINYNLLKVRADIVIYNNQGSPLIIVECKSPEVSLTKDTFYQISKYNSQLMVKYLILTNGIDHYCCRMKYDQNQINFLKNILLLKKCPLAELMSFCC